MNDSKSYHGTKLIHSFILDKSKTKQKQDNFDWGFLKPKYQQDKPNPNAEIILKYAAWCNASC